MSAGASEDRWAFSGIPESLARALRARGEEVVRVSSDLPRALERNGARLARRMPGLAVTGGDAPPFVRLRSRRLAGLDLDWAGSRVVVCGSTFRTPRTDATFEDMTVAQCPLFANSMARDRWRTRQRAIYETASVCVTSTEWAASSVREDYGQPSAKVVVGGFGPNIVCRPVPKDWSRPRLLWVGADWHRKGGDRLLAAFASARIPGATLDLVGHHPAVDVPGVTGHGAVRDPDRLAAMFEAATLFVLPSRFDASPIVLLEAATAGTPLLATRTGGTAEHVGNAGITVRSGDGDALVAAMRALSDPTVAARHRAAALAQARSRTWDRVAARMSDALDAVTVAPAPSDD